jgi:hypothetical protein
LIQPYRRASSDAEEQFFLAGFDQRRRREPVGIGKGEPMPRRVTLNSCALAEADANVDKNAATRTIVLIIRPNLPGSFLLIRGSLAQPSRRASLS